MKRNREIVEDLFQVFSKNLALIASNVDGDEFICPLCGDGFDRDCLNDGLLTLEHLVPESVGGRVTTLACKRCNSGFGSDVDHHLAARVRDREFYAGVSQRAKRVRLQPLGGEFAVNAELRLDRSNSFNFFALPEEHQRPGALEMMDAYLASGEVTLNFKLSHNGDPTRSTLALLRAAHLALFHVCGYRYLLDPAGTSTVAHLQAWKANPEGAALAVQRMDGVTFADEPFVIMMGKVPGVGWAHLVGLTYGEATKHRSLAMIPPLGEGDPDFWERVKRNAVPGKIDLKVMDRSPRSWLTLNAKSARSLEWTWNALRRGEA